MTKDRQRWIHWLFEAKKRFGLTILNYVVTSNHIHLLVVDGGNDVIPKSIQLVAGRTAQEFNQRKKRKGAFWEDRYHAVAVETDEHLLRCLVYIDLNMVRAGVVKHPSDWQHGGYREILNPPKRYSIIDQKVLINKCGYKDNEQFLTSYEELVETATRGGQTVRDPVWSESIAVGGKKFISDIGEKLGVKAKGRKAVQKSESFMLKEHQSSYRTDFRPDMGLLRLKNMHYWDIYDDIPDS